VQGTQIRSGGHEGATENRGRYTVWKVKGGTSE
jgi:hypothetical protein